MRQNSLEHVFSVCAYKESPFLEICIKSLLHQSDPSPIIVCTSTPCDYIRKICDRNGVPLHIRNGKSTIKDDWNFAYNEADADYVTLAHQDDVYSTNYAHVFKEQISGDDRDVILFLTDYLPLKNNRIEGRDINSAIRHFLRIPLKNEMLAKKKKIRKWTLAFGNSICCPTVTYHKGRLGDNLFVSSYNFNIDWDTFLMLANKNGRFVYADEPLVFYRVHDGATSKEFIENHLRISEDSSMFRQFWPAWFVRFIMVFYKKAYETYN